MKMTKSWIVFTVLFYYNFSNIEITIYKYMSSIWHTLYHTFIWLKFTVDLSLSLEESRPGRVVKEEKKKRATPTYFWSRLFFQEILMRYVGWINSDYRTRRDLQFLVNRTPNHSDGPTTGFEPNNESKRANLTANEVQILIHNLHIIIHNFVHNEVFVHNLHHLCHVS